MFYPLRFKPIFKEKIWGGGELAASFNKNFNPNVKIGESWEISAVSKNESIVTNGKFKGENLEELVVEYKDLILGKRVYEKNGYEFPLLIKFLDANDSLSVQVHPDDVYAKERYQSFGKTEIWFVLQARENAQIIAGLKDGTTASDIKKAIDEKKITDYLNYIPVKTGDVVFIPAGRVHGLLEGTVIAEVQQTSDITFRLYDWDKVDQNGKGRDLHIDEALRVIDFEDKTEPLKIEKNFEEKGGVKKAPIISCDFFKIEEIHIASDSIGYKNTTDAEQSFEIIMCLDGSGKLKYDKDEEEIKKGDSLLLPACLGEYEIEGDLKLLRVFM